MVGAADEEISEDAGISIEAVTVLEIDSLATTLEGDSTTETEDSTTGVVT